MSKYQEMVGEYKQQFATFGNPELGEQVIVGRLADGSTVKGPAETGDLRPGQVYRFFGAWTDHPRFGRQFAFDAFTSTEPHSRHAIVEYLQQTCKGCDIGFARAHRLCDEYGAEAVRVLRDRPAEAAKVMSITPEAAARASWQLQQQARDQSARIELVGMFSGIRFPKVLIQQCLKRWKGAAPAIIQRDAYKLLTAGFKGVGFLRADQLYLRLGGNPARLKRQALCAWYALHDDHSGDTWRPVRFCRDAILAKISGVEAKPDRAIAVAVRAGWIAQREHGGTIHLAEARRARAEETIARETARMGGPSAWPLDALDELEAQLPPERRISAHQREQLAEATRCRLGILAGTPGTGKTYTAAALVRAIIAGEGAGVVAVAAPTGKAAARSREALAKCGVDLKPTTIHRLLGPQGNGYGTGDWSFQHGLNLRLAAKYIIIDEPSMIDTDLMAALLSAVGHSASVLMVGDPYQLPPVGHGAPLRDLLDVWPSKGLLTEVRRNEGLIVKSCRSIKERGRLIAAPRFDLATGDNLRLVECGSAAQTLLMLQEVYAAISAKGELDPVEGVQVLVGVNSKSPLGRDRLNPMLQQVLNPRPPMPNTPFRPFDKVICTSNGMYEAVGIGGSRTEAYVANGETARVSEVTDAHAIVRLPGDGSPGSDRVVKLIHKSEPARKWELAYAITAHKSQGSEWPFVIVIADDYAGARWVCSREWWYTAVSRASHCCLILGSAATVEKHCQRVTLRDRKTFLAGDLKAAMAIARYELPPLETLATMDATAAIPAMEGEPCLA